MQHSPTDYGWILTEEEKYAPKWFEGEMAPAALDDILQNDTQEDEEEDDEVHLTESEEDSSDDEDEEV